MSENPVNFIPITASDIRVVADTHFRDPGLPGEDARRERFLKFVDSLAPGTCLVLLGDIFDFYFEYRSVVSRRYLDIYEALDRCQARNIDVHFLGGNHDHWVGEFFSRDLGVTIHQTEIPIAAQGRKLILAHGDLVMPRDYGYKVLKAVIRNRAVVGASRWIHPDLLDAIARGVAHGSREYFSVPQDKRARAVLEHAWGNYFRRGNDAFVMGHVHYPMHETRDGREFMILGDWLQHFTYGRLSGGRLRLETVRS
ncbi:MAG TPA: UDP-2,3-diacylglucosamine diphosphatase [Candidatus Krumholzibacteria bacterium]|nr:UDP-2,3-diacylglucosamine diphosphatase [Candidatus Krumholzibacteria bacterium]